MRSTLLGFMLVTCIAAASPRVVEAIGGKSARPNIIFLLADDVNRDTWGIYGSSDCSTPNIDRLAADGMRFDNAYCSVAMCAPFRQELYSGRSPWRTGTLANHSKSKSGTKSIAHYLKPLGYRVALVGKSHVGPRDCYPFEYFLAGDKRKDQNPFYLQKTRLIMDECMKSEQPFCIFVTSNDGHGPHTTGDPSAYDAGQLTIPPYWVDTPELRSALVKYYAEITNFDVLVGQMRAELEARGLWDNTIFVVCSEQGASFPFAKWSCFDNGLHTGLVWHWSGVTPPGSVTEELVSMADVTPTLVAAAGGSLKSGACDGKRFIKMLKGENQVLHDHVFGAFTNCKIIGNRDRIYPIRVIRNSSFSLIYNPKFRSQTSNVTLDGALAMLEDPALQHDGIAPSWVRRSREDSAAEPFVRKLHHRPEYELYNLTTDPYELKNEVDNPEHAATFLKLKRELHAQLAERGDSDPVATERALVRTKHGN
jgi:N-sulfoglucosamine sulfohydrolase